MYLFEKKPAAKVSITKIVVISSAVVLGVLGVCVVRIVDFLSHNDTF